MKPQLIPRIAGSRIAKTGVTVIFGSYYDSGTAASTALVQVGPVADVHRLLQSSGLATVPLPGQSRNFPPPAAVYSFVSPRLAMLERRPASRER